MLSALDWVLRYPTEDSESREVKITNPCWQSRWRKRKQNLRVIRHPHYSTNNHNPLPAACGTGFSIHRLHCTSHTHGALATRTSLPSTGDREGTKAQHLASLHLSSVFLQINFFFFVASFGLFKSWPLQSGVCLLFYHKVKLLSKYDHNLGWCLRCSFVLQ